MFYISYDVPTVPTKKVTDKLPSGEKFRILLQLQKIIAAIIHYYSLKNNKENVTQ